MPENHLNQKLKEALVATGHNRHDAQKLLLTWAVRDPVLLLALTKPHLKAIAAGHIDHFMRQTSGKKSAALENESITRSMIGDIVPTSERRQRSSVPPPKSTERQASTMRRLADAFSIKKKK